MKFFQKVTSAVTSAVLTASMLAGGSAALFTSTNAADKSAIQIVNEMGMGWNLGNTFDCWGTRDWTTDTETAWGNVTTTQDMITAIKASGFDSIRIPVTWYENITDPTTYDIDDAYLARIKEVVDYAYANNMYVIVNMHWDWVSDGSLWLNKGAEALPQFKTMWTEIANYFKDYDQHLVFESMNEVTFDYDVLNNFNQSFVDVMRQSGGNNADRLLLLAGKNDDLAQTCSDSYIVPDDDMVAVSIHYYTPSTFCVADINASWGHTETWGTETEIQDVYNNFNKMKETFVDKGIPVIVGEYGVLTTEKDQKDRDDIKLYLNTVASTALAIDGLSAFLWDAGNAGDMQFFDRKELQWFDPTIAAVYQNLKQNGAGIRFEYESTKEVTIPLAEYKDENGYTVNVAGYGANGEKLEKVILNGKLAPGSESAGYGIGFSATRGGESGVWTAETASVDSSGTGTAIFDGIFESEDGNIPYEFEFSYLQIQNWWGGTADLDSVTLVFDKGVTTVNAVKDDTKPTPPETPAPSESEPDTTVPTESEPDTTVPEVIPTESQPDSTQTPPENILWGDANCDGNVDISDVVLMNRVYVGVDQVSDEGLQNADVDQSGKIELADSMNVLKLLVHLLEP
ncbi:MAG: cellulase family glycosylhydrolase, partial [Oscillospiraceae bacterium]|nr:cellulase family glycosylhydrolase [Oscillospiraceae bacterium]